MRFRGYLIHGLLLALTYTAAVSGLTGFVDECCKNDVPPECCIIGDISPVVRTSLRFEFINTLCSNDCEKYLTCVENAGQTSLKVSQTSIGNASLLNAFMMGEYVLGPNFCQLDCLTLNGAFPDLSTQSGCIDAATLNGTCSEECRGYLREVDIPCKEEMIASRQMGSQIRLLYQECGISDPATAAAPPAARGLMMSGGMALAAAFVIAMLLR